jgi:hypothetical protein
MDLVDLEFLSWGVWQEKNGVELFFFYLELRGALPNTPMVVIRGLWTILVSSCE